MTPNFLLVILTMMDSGGLSAAFVNTDTFDTCEQRGKVIRSILSQGKIDIRTMKCFKSDLKFKKFSHNTPAKAPRYRYLVTLNGETVTVATMKDAHACNVAVSNNKTTFCTTSSQMIEK